MIAQVIYFGGLPKCDLRLNFPLDKQKPKDGVINSIPKRRSRLSSLKVSLPSTSPISENGPTPILIMIRRRNRLCRADVIISFALNRTPLLIYFIMVIIEEEEHQTVCLLF